MGGKTFPSLFKYCQTASLLQITRSLHRESRTRVAEVQYGTAAQQAIFASPIHNITSLKNLANDQEADTVRTHSLRCITKSMLESTG